jgi:hypothetical protein
VSDLQIVHGRDQYAFIVAADFSSSAHLHHEDFRALNAVDTRAAECSFAYVFPAGGRYRLYDEFMHRDRTWLKRFALDVRGPVLAATGKPLGLRAHDRSVRGQLALLPRVPVAGHKSELALSLSHGGEPANPQLWLGAEVYAAT